MYVYNISGGVANIFYQSCAQIDNNQQVYEAQIQVPRCKKGITQGGRTRRAPPLKLVKIGFFWRKIVIFHMKYPKNFAPPSARSNFFKCAPP